MKSFEEADAWKDARELTRQVRLVCKKPQINKDFAWVDQISRAGLSIMANIAEGFDAQSDRELAMFLGFAKRSAAEVRSHLYYGKDEGYFSDEEFFALGVLTKKIGAGLANWIRYLRHSDFKVRNQQAEVAMDK